MLEMKPEGSRLQGLKSSKEGGKEGPYELHHIHSGSVKVSV